MIHAFLVSVFGFSSTCHQTPSCSEYTMLQMQEHGTIRGLWRGLNRAVKCYKF